MLSKILTAALAMAERMALGPYEGIDFQRIFEIGWFLAKSTRRLSPHKRTNQSIPKEKPHMSIVHRVSQLAAAAALSLGLVGSAVAGAVQWQWASSTVGTTTSSQVGNVATFSETSSRTPFGQQQWAVSGVVDADGDFSFDYQLNGFFAFFQVTLGLVATDAAGDHVILAEGPASCGACNPPSGGFNYTGSYTFSGLTAGETIQMRWTGNNGDSNRTMDSTLRLTQTSQIPEPMSIALVGAALLGMAAVSRRKV